VSILQVVVRFLPVNGRLRLEDQGKVFHNLADGSKFPQGLRPTREKNDFYISPNVAWRGASQRDLARVDVGDVTSRDVTWGGLTWRATWGAMQRDATWGRDVGTRCDVGRNVGDVSTIPCVLPHLGLVQTDSFAVGRRQKRFSKEDLKTLRLQLASPAPAAAASSLYHFTLALVSRS
jgi:hypothetical protein